MNGVMRKTLLVALLAGMAMQPAAAEEVSSPVQGMDHSQMQGMDHSQMQGMDHSQMQGMDHGAPNAGSDAGMSGAHDMGSMQGGKAPPDARDPHAFADGLTLVSGPYVLPHQQRLKLADEHKLFSLLVDRLEAVQTADEVSTAYDLQAWFGRDYDRAVLKAEGHYEANAFKDTSTELLWSHAVTPYWNRELGVRYDGGEDPSRTWLAFGFQGLAPYWFEVDATAYIGEEGRTALGLEAEYETLLTQKLILQSRIETSLYGKDDAARGIGSGLADTSVGFRLRYEIRREFAPYVGVEWAGKFGGTADYARAAGKPTSETKAVAGLRFWF